MSNTPGMSSSAAKRTPGSSAAKPTPGSSAAKPTPWSSDVKHIPDERPRDATEHSHVENALPTHAGEAPEHTHALLPASSTASPHAPGSKLQCCDCERPLCSTEDIAFFRRVNKQGGVEVHLMLKPENKEPATFIRAPIPEKGATSSWQCACGFNLGNTRPIAVNTAPMTAFKSSSVILCGQRFTNKKSQWPSVYKQPPFNAIEVRTRDTFFGPMSA